MSVIIRLQNLPWSANAHDIREFFKGLGIPEGGVHIVGGELGDAFIAFSSDEDARLAMQKSGSSLKGIQISLLLSSRSEMQKVIETARQQAMGLQSFLAPVPIVQPPAQPTVQPQFQAPVPVPNQTQRLQTDEHVHQNPPNPNMFAGRPQQTQNMFAGRPQQIQNFSQPFNTQPPNTQPPNTQPPNTQPPNFLSNQLPYQEQKVPSFPPGVVPPGGMPSQFFGQPPPVTLPSAALNNHLPNSENSASPNISQNFPVLGHHPSNYAMTPPQQLHQPIPQQQSEVDKRDKRPVSLSSTSSRDKRERDNKGRDDRRRRSKSRSRSKDRDRRRRHRSRSRSRSRDKSARRKRSRSRDRDRTREKERERDRQRDRKENRPHRDNKPEKSVQEMIDPKPKIVDTVGGIPGLGEIPDDIPKEGLSIFNQVPDTLVQTQVSPTNPGWPKKENTIEPKPFNQPLAIPEKPQQSKPFLLANPPLMNPFSPPNAPLLSNPPMMNAPQNVRPYKYSSPYQDENGQGGSKEPLLQSPKEEGFQNYNSDNRREYSQESFDQRKFRDEDRGIRNSSHSRDRSYDNTKRAPNSWEGNDWSGKDGEKAPPRGEWGRFSRRDDEYNYNEKEKPDTRPMDQDNNDRRDHAYGPRGFAGNYQNDYNSEYDDRYDRGGFRGRVRRGFGREGERGLEPPPRMPGMFKDDDPSYRDRYMPDFDRGRGGRGFIRGRGGRVNPMPDYLRDRRVKTCSVEILHVPHNASYKVIRELFNGIVVPNGSIKIVGDQQGNRIGVALVQFTSTRDAYEAYKRSGNYIFDSRVQINFVDDLFFLQSKDVKDFGKSINQPTDEVREVRTEERNTSSCLYVSGLPVGCTDHDVGKLFESYKVNNLVLELEKGSRQPSGGCFVNFISVEEAKEAYAGTKHANVDGTPVKVEFSTLEEMESAAKEREKLRHISKGSQNQSNQEAQSHPAEIGTKEHLKAITQHLAKLSGSGNTKRSKENENLREKNLDSNGQNNGDNSAKKMGADLLTDSVVIKNVSSEITETSVRDFFSDEGLMPEKIYLNRPDSEGKCDVFVIFPKISDAKHAVDKNLQQLGSTNVTVELISKPTVMLAMGLPFDPRELFQKGHNENLNDTPRGISKQQQDEDEDEDDNDNDDFADSSEPVVQKFSNNFDNHYRGRGYNPRFQRGHEPFHGGYRPPRYPMGYRREMEIYPPERSNFDDRISENSPENSKNSSPPDDFGKPGCVIALANVPYHATTEDILHFFKEFENLQPENIIRRYDERNRPTSDSRVSLSSPAEAFKAIEFMNRKFMLGRPIYLSLVN